MMDSFCKIHVKLLAFDLLSLNPTSSSSSSSDPCFFSRNGYRLSRAEVVGTVTSRELKPQFLKFTVDDGTGCVPCVLWLNHHTSAYFSSRNPSDVRVLAASAELFASRVALAAVVRVRGRITAFRGAVQITASDVVAERDPNVEILHWLDCIRLARKSYDVVPSPTHSLPNTVV